MRLLIGMKIFKIIFLGSIKVAPLPKTIFALTWLYTLFHFVPEIVIKLVLSKPLESLLPLSRCCSFNDCFQKHTPMSSQAATATLSQISVLSSMLLATETASLNQFR
mmetsp:Transcript_5642/g.9415  ORF Transcript_5642/g.9415 Transcript_5642/m.9415 type:complete len:107 (+) Transcript_5642:110-430(+)